MTKQQPQKAPAPQPTVSSAPIPLLQPRAFGEIEQPAIDESPQAEMESKLGEVALGHSLGRINTRPLSHLPIQPKLTIGKVNDPYEQEADRVAAQVVSRIHAPESQTVASPKLQRKATLQRQSLVEVAQRQEDEEELQMKSLTDSVQRQEEDEELQMKPLAESIQRSEGHEEENEELQMKPNLQRRADVGGMAASTDLESSINQARGGGQGMSDSIRQPMEQAFGADFGGVRVHTDSQADQLSRSINAKAFTTKNDIFFSKGAYNPGDRGGQELLAHELTHVVQQNGSSVNRSPQLQEGQIQRERVDDDELGMADETWATFLESQQESRQNELAQVSNSIQDRQNRGFKNQRQEQEAQEAQVAQEAEIVPEESSKPVYEAAPEFESHFEDTSIGVESELGGIVCALPQNSVQKFAFVRSAEGEPLVIITKDMKQGAYANPAKLTNVKPKDQWQTHTVELVTYPSVKKDKTAKKNRTDAMLFLADLFTKHVTTHNHQPLKATTSEDGRFQLVISYADHVLAGGQGGTVDGEGASASMSPASSGQQATIGVKAKDFGTGSSPELLMLEAAPWYQANLKNDEIMTPLANKKAVQDSNNPVVQDSNNSVVQDLETVQNVYAYLMSILSFTAGLCRKWGIPIGDWDPVTENIKMEAQGLTDPRVKNEWSILPRTKPSKMLDLLKSTDRKLVTTSLQKKGPSIINGSTMWKAVFQYFIYDNGEVAGHGINKATIGDSEHPEAAALFEFRTLPGALYEYIPTTGVAKETKLFLDQFPPKVKGIIRKKVNEAVTKAGEEFDTWYHQYREMKGKPPTKNPRKIASENEKAEWMQTVNSDEWQKIVEAATNEAAKAKPEFGQVPNLSN